MHCEEKPHTCSICGKSFNPICLMPKHMKIHCKEKFNCEPSTNICSLRSEGKRRSKENQYSYSCVICSLSFLLTCSMKFHEANGIRYELLSCQVCDEFNPGLDHFKKHKQLLHGIVKLECEQCGRDISMMSHLFTQMQSIHEGPKYSCDECEYKVTPQQCLSNHRKCSHDQIHFCCKTCKFEETFKVRLQQHGQVAHVKSHP